MIVFRLILFMLFVSLHHCRLPDKVYCVNEECSEPISRAKTLLSYNSGDSDLISFKANADAIVLMKSAGANPDLWYARINGQEGLVNSKFLRETKLFVKAPPVIKPFEVKAQPLPAVQPDKVQQAHEVIDGTTIYTTEPPTTVPQQDNPPEVPQSESTPSLPPAADENEVQQEVVAPTVYNDSAQPSVPIPAPENTASETIEVSNVQEKQDSIVIDNNKNIETVPIETKEPTPVVSPPVVPAIKPPTIPASVPEQEMPQAELNIGSENIDNIIKTEAIDINNAIQNEPEASILPIAQPLLANPSDSSMLSDNFVNVPEKSNFIEPPPTQPEATETEQNTSTNILNNMETITETQPEIPEAQVPNEILLNTEQSKPMLAQNEVPIPPQFDEVPQNVFSNPPENVNGEAAHEPMPTQPPQKVEEPTIETIEPVQSYIYPPIEETIPETIPEQTTAAPITDSQYNYMPSVAVTEEPTTSSPSYYSEPITEESVTTEAIPQYDPTESTTEAAAQEDSSEGFLSGMYSTISDMWPSSTESTPTSEGLYITETTTESVADSNEKLESILEELTPPLHPGHIYHSQENHESEPAEPVEEEGGFSFLGYFTSFYSSLMGWSDEKALFASPGETCFKHEFPEDGSQGKNSRLLMFLLTSAGSMLLFTLGYYYIDVKRQDGKFVGMVNSLQRDLLCSTKECEILKEELTTTKSKLAGIEDSSFGMDDMVKSLKDEIEELMAQNERLRHSLDDNEKLLRVSENTAGELQNTLGEVENTLSELLAERAQSEEHIAELNQKLQAFEEELISVSRDRDSFQLKFVSAEAALDDMKRQKTELEELNNKFSDAANTIELQRHEISALKDALKELQAGGSSNVDVSSLIDHTEIKAQLAKALEEKNSFESKFKSELAERTRLAEELSANSEALRARGQQAAEACTRLEVLEKYFQEREAELMKELSTKEALYLSKKGESASTVEKIELLQQEVQRFKEKCDALTLELAEQESSRRTTVAELESRAHTAWLEARAAKRQAAAEQEASAVLRRKLGALTAAAEGPASPQHRISSPLEATEGAIPPLPLAFLPPPLLPPPPLPRPPPLGRLPSPHPPRYGDRRYSPDSRYSPETRYSPESRYSPGRYSPGTVRYSPDSRYSPDRRRRLSRERYSKDGGRGSRHNGPVMDTETEAYSDSPTRSPRRRRYSRHSGPSSGSGCSSESDK
ncbi:transport and Golgi organization protein 1 [Plutella xylostella]|uniref:transport and Golgi organization protein 1 n=1 Tax=Plutella xylostella TaxID=51655 RepID=UPI002032A379|nr:transport and Golgi organization protein 1 [Plutella xylostella]